jgi:ATP-binding cassette subfamily C protein CydD
MNMNDKFALAVASGADVLGAGLFGFGLSRGVGALAGAQGLPTTAMIALAAGPCLRVAANWWQAWTAQALGHRLAANWHGRVIPRLLGGRLATPLAPGEIAALGTDHIAAIRAYGEKFLPARQGAVAGPVMVLALVGSASWVSALILGLTLVVFITGMILAGTAARRASERQLAALSGLSAIFVDRITHLPLIRHFGAEERLGRQVGAATAEVARRTLAVLRIAFLSGAVLEFVAALAVALVAVYCGFGLLGMLPFAPPERLTLTSAFFVLTMAPEFYLPTRRLAAAYHEKQLGEAAMRALSDVVAAPVEEAPLAGKPWSGMAVRDVVIAWPGTTIGPVSFEIGSHGLIALTGPTGAGKSSVLLAIAGQVAPASGIIVAADGQEVPRQSVAICAQQPLLLPGTLAENLVLARPDVTAEEILAVVRQTGLDAALAGRPDGIDAVIDHRGSGFSGGERKRIGLARALLSGRPLLLLDEPTADLDSDSAKAISGLIVDIARERPVIVATHDPVLVALADREVML